MGQHQRYEYLTAMLVGLHYAKTHFSLANSFTTILDSVCDLSNFKLYSSNGNEIVFKAGGIKASISTQFLVVNSQITVGKNLFKYLPKKRVEGRGKYIQLPASIYGTKFEKEDMAAHFDSEATKKFRDSFLNESAEMINLLDKIIIDGIPAFRYIGIIEYYAIPLNVARWDILEDFKQQAKIKGGDNTEKRAINRYYFPKRGNVDERCLVFHLEKPDNHRDPSLKVAGAKFDFQFIPEKPKSLSEYGGAESMIKSLAKGIEDIIKISTFMKLSKKEIENDATSDTISS